MTEFTHGLSKSGRSARFLAPKAQRTVGFSLPTGNGSLFSLAINLRKSRSTAALRFHWQISREACREHGHRGIEFSTASKARAVYFRFLQAEACRNWRSNLKPTTILTTPRFCLEENG